MSCLLGPRRRHRSTHLLLEVPRRSAFTFFISIQVVWNTSSVSGVKPSPTSGKKLSYHVAMKCGYICIKCRQCDIKEDRIYGTVCSACPSSRHQIIKKGVQCQNCDELSDCATTFIHEACRGRSDTKIVTRSPSQVRTSPCSDPPKRPSPAQAKKFMELRMAEMEMARLLMLESLEKERRQLQLLREQKSQASGHPNCC